MIFQYISRYFIIFTIGIITAVAHSNNIFAQSYDYEDDYIDLWENERQEPDTIDGERYYKPDQDFPGSTPYITDEEIRILNEIENEEDVFAEEIFVEVREPDYLPSSQYLSAYYLSNITYGITAGVLIGGILTFIDVQSFRDSLSNIGIGAVVGGLFGYAFARYYEPNLVRSLRDEKREDLIRELNQSSNINKSYTIPVFATNF